MSDCLLVLTNFPDLPTARQIGATLVEKQLAACVNLLPPTESIYRWKDAVETAQEIPTLIKTTRDGFERLAAEFHALHPYEVPELIAIPIEAGLPAYLDWVRENVR